MSKLHDILLEFGMDKASIQKAQLKASEDDISIKVAVEKLKLLPDDKMLEAFSKFYNVKSVDLQALQIPTNVLNLVPTDLAKKLRVVPVEHAGSTLVVAVSDPMNRETIESLRFKLKMNIKPVIAKEDALAGCVERYYNNKTDLSSFATDEEDDKPIVDENRIIIGEDNPSDGPVIKLVNFILTQCVDKDASDIHIEPYETSIRIRLRIDGALVEIARPPNGLKDALTSRVKIMGGMDISERRKPQDGNISIELKGKPLDFRVNCLPTVYGEKIVMRILDKSALEVDMTKLGFFADDLKIFKETIHRPFGMVLVTGPTGSGKTTTLYSALAELNKETENIMTAEDPVEFQLEGINQVQMKPDVGLTFASALKAFLRQDPDIILVGEVRDLETAGIAIKAALTGHMVLSTLHTNTAADTIVRLLNMGVESFNLVSALNAVVAQRLARKVCTHCKTVDEDASPDALIDLGINPQYARRIKAYKGIGCEKCNYLGNSGRTALHEVMPLSDELKAGILAGKSAPELKKIAISNGMRTLRQNALTKLAQGILSAVEVVKNTAADKDKKNENAA